MITETKLSEAQYQLQVCEEQLKELIIERIHDEDYEFNGGWLNVVTSLVDDDKLYALAQKFEKPSLFLNEDLYCSSNYCTSNYYNNYYGFDAPTSLSEMNVIIAYSLFVKYLEENTESLYAEEMRNI